MVQLKKDVRIASVDVQRTWLTGDALRQIKNAMYGGLIVLRPVDTATITDTPAQARYGALCLADFLTPTSIHAAPHRACNVEAHRAEVDLVAFHAAVPVTA
jgi:hypothetical protein